jgi:hypothetical protein
MSTPSITPYLWGRAYSLTIQTTQGDTISLSSDTFEPEALRFTFEIETAAMVDLWTCTIKIFNLNYSTASIVIGQGSTVQISAGYQSGQQYGTIWNGTVLWVEVTKERATDSVLMIQSIVGDNQINPHMSFAAGPYQTQRQLVMQMAKAAGFTVNDPGNMIDDTAQLPCPKVFFGQPKDYMHDAVRNANTWGFPDFEGGFNVLSLKLASETPELIYAAPIPAGSNVQPQPGLSYSIISTPKQVLVADTLWGVSFKVLLDSRLRISAMPQLIKIDASALIEQAAASFGAPPPILSTTGQYAVVALGHIGDTRGNEWYSEVLAVQTAGVQIGFPSSDGKDNRAIRTAQGGN